MIYGLYQSATGLLVSAHRQDVIANNLANVETTGFKRNLAMLQQRPTASQEKPGATGASNPMLDRIGGGIFVSPSSADLSQGELEPTGNALDLAIDGAGFFLVKHGETEALTRDGRLAVDREGYVTLASDSNKRLLDTAGRLIRVAAQGAVQVASDGQISQNGEAVARLALVKVPEGTPVRKIGGNLFRLNDPASLTPAAAQLRSGFIERANVDPASELAALMDAQRQLEANANMIRYQDQTLGRLVNEVGKIG